jgi:excisionase family DNA binding protein
MSAALVEAIRELSREVQALKQAAQQPARQAWRPREVADLTGIRYEVVLQLIHSGELGSVPAGRLHVVPDVELQRYLSRGVQAEQRVAS